MVAHAPGEAFVSGKTRRRTSKQKKTAAETFRFACDPKSALAATNKEQWN